MMLESFSGPPRPVMMDSDKIVYTRFTDLLTAYLEEHLKGKSSYRTQGYVAKQWLLTLTEMPTRAQILARQRVREGTPSTANTEVQLLRAAVRWGLYHQRWQGEDPTVGIKKFKTKKRKRVTKREEIKKLLAYFEAAETRTEVHNRALFGLMLFTGCRPGEARCAKLESITPYGTMGCWNKGTTKNGEEYEVPVPSQYMKWLDAWKAIRPARPNPYLFPGHGYERLLTERVLVHLWRDLRLVVGLPGLWNYDLRRSLATHMSNELNYSDAKIDAILGHEKTSSLGHYLHVSFDAMTEPIQRYADWLCGLRGQLEEPTIQEKEEHQEPVRVSAEEDAQRLQSLSGRERDVLAWFARGESCTNIAARLRLSLGAVNGYRAGLLRKLGLTSTVALVHYAVQHHADLPPVIAPPVVSPMMPAPLPMAYSSHRVEREEWPG